MENLQTKNARAALAFSPLRPSTTQPIKYLEFERFTRLPQETSIDSSQRGLKVNVAWATEGFDHRSHEDLRP